MIVIDASLAVRMLDDEEGNYELNVELLAAGARDIRVPAHFKTEVLNAYRGLYLKGVISAERLKTLFRRTGDLPVTTYEIEQLIPGIHQLKDNATVYDAAYLVLADELGCVFATGDERLAKMAATHTNVEIFTFPASL